MKLNVKIEDIPFGTNIQDIEVPDVLKTKVPSGLGYFDYALGGRGFTPSLCGLFTGTPGAGKTTMMLTLANALQGHGSRVARPLVTQGLRLAHDSLGPTLAATRRWEEV